MPSVYFQCGIHADLIVCDDCKEDPTTGITKKLCAKHKKRLPNCFECRKVDEKKKFEEVKSSLTEHDRFVIKWHYNWDTGEMLPNPPKDMMDLRGLVDDEAKLDKMLDALKNRRAILAEKRMREIKGNPLLWFQTSRPG